MRYHRFHLLTIALLATGLLTAAARCSESGPVYVDPGVAAKKSEAYKVQGEYSGNTGGRKAGAQVIAKGNGKFQARLFADGLPGAGYDGEGNTFMFAGQRENGRVVLEPGEDADLDMETRIVIRDGQLRVRNEDRPSPLQRKDRQSPTLGKKPPKNAIVLFDGTKQSLKHWRNGEMTEDGLLKQGTRTKDKFHAFTLHVEFRLSFKPNASGQHRGNSGVYLLNRYEVQLLDSFGLPPQNNGCGALYEFKAPRLNMTYPPLTWQTYDITFTGPKFNDSGEKTKKARVTVRHNGVVIHDDVALPPGTGAGKKRDEVETGPIVLQGHHNPARFRNVWLVPAEQRSQ